jgi:site-specific DNA-methyltransferase (adenine-specific)
VGDESIDLVYLDPPFNSNANYNVIFAPPKGLRTRQDEQHAQIEAFEDTWHWNDKAEDAFDQVARSGRIKAFDLLNAMRAFLGENDMMAYLAMMAVRLIELHRVLKPTGSLYLHCDPTASHYLKLLLDGVFGPQFYRNEIIWKRTSAHANSTRNLASIHDIVFVYGKSSKTTYNPSFTPYSDAYVEQHFVHVDSGGRRFRRSDLRNPGLRPNLKYDYTASNGVTYKPHPNGWAVSRETMERLDREGRLFFPHKQDGRLRKKIYLDESPGVPTTDIWDDLPPIHATAAERLGYPTQKPLALLERIIAASSNEGDVVLDPFCGCGTAVHAAQRLGRRWIGIDVTHLAISLIERRMEAAFPGIKFTVEGTPQDLASAQDLARRDKYQFQWWACSMVDAMPFGGKKKGADGGIDGIIYFKPDGRRTERAIVSVKGGENVGVQMIRDLHSTMERERAPIGIFITRALPSGPMEREAAAVGRFHADATGRSYPRLQILTLAELFQGKRPDIPFVDPTAAFRRAPREAAVQERLI